jgi:hypothetical protein
VRERERVRERARERERERGGWTEGKIERQQAEEKWGRKGCTHLRALLEPVKLIPRIVIVVTRVHLRRVGVLHFHLRTDRNVLRTHRQRCTQHPKHVKGRGAHGTSVIHVFWVLRASPTTLHSLFFLYRVAFKRQTLDSL